MDIYVYIYARNFLLTCMCIRVVKIKNEDDLYIYNDAILKYIIYQREMTANIELKEKSVSSRMKDI